MQDFGQNDDPLPMLDGSTRCFGPVGPVSQPTVIVFMRKELKLPPVMQPVEHNNGLLYLVVGYNNLRSTHPDHPPMVEYVGENGIKWSKSLVTWHDKMKPSTREFKFADPHAYLDNQNVAR